MLNDLKNKNSSLVYAGAYARLRRSDNTSGSPMRLSDLNGYCQGRILRIKSYTAIMVSP